MSKLQSLTFYIYLNKQYGLLKLLSDSVRQGDIEAKSNGQDLEKENWFHAKQACSSRNGSLFVFNNQKDLDRAQHFLNGLVQNKQRKKINKR